MTPKELARYTDYDLKYEDYKLILNAKAGQYEKKDAEAMKLLQPYYDKGYIDINREGDIWLTEKGVRMLQSVGCDPLDPRDFLNNYPHMLDRMEGMDV